MAEQKATNVHWHEGDITREHRALVAQYLRPVFTCDVTLVPVHIGRFLFCHGQYSPVLIQIRVVDYTASVCLRAIAYIFHDRRGNVACRLVWEGKVSTGSRWDCTTFASGNTLNTNASEIAEGVDGQEVRVVLHRQGEFLTGPLGHPVVAGQRIVEVIGIDRI